MIFRIACLLAVADAVGDAEAIAILQKVKFGDEKMAIHGSSAGDDGISSGNNGSSFGSSGLVLVGEEKYTQTKGCPQHNIDKEGSLLNWSCFTKSMLYTNVWLNVIPPDQFVVCAKKAVGKPIRINVQSARPEKFTTGAVGVNLVTQMDQIYVICMECETVSLPMDWAEKVLLVSGSASDQCFGTQQIPLDGRHSVSATLSHMVAIWHAKLSGHKRIAVIEDDFLYADTNVWGESAIEELNKFVQKSTWQVFRLDVDPRCDCDGECRERCTCSRVPAIFQDNSISSGRVLCTVEAPGGTVQPGRNCYENHSTGAYLLNDHVPGVFDAMLQGTGIIDATVINNIQQTLVLPAIFMQPTGQHAFGGDPRDQALSQRKYLAGRCVA